MATVISSNRPGSIKQASEVRSLVVELGEALDYELTYKELVRFLPQSTLEEFINHLQTVADIEDLIN